MQIYALGVPGFNWHESGLDFIWDYKKLFYHYVLKIMQCSLKQKTSRKDVFFLVLGTIQKLGNLALVTTVINTFLYLWRRFLNTAAIKALLSLLSPHQLAVMLLTLIIYSLPSSPTLLDTNVCNCQFFFRIIPRSNQGWKTSSHCSPDKSVESGVSVWLYSMQ